MKEIIEYFGLVVVMIVFLFGALFYFSKKAERIEIISPQDGVKCVIVSRMFHTSIDCWSE